AQAAFEQKKLEVAQNYLEKAEKIAKPSEKITLNIIRARWQLQMKNYASALQILLLLQETNPHHPFVLTRLKEIYLESQNWEKLRALSPLLKKYTLLDASSLNNLERNIFSATLKNSKNTLTEINAAWEEIPSAWKNDPQLLAMYAGCLIEQK